ncbi:MAG: hypothetical protein IJH87_03590, partial [Atopobiaceae bacterium]|nr:hypothetical protein [Atopobiaceae bacterium]
MSSTGPLIPRPLISRLVNRLNSAGKTVLFIGRGPYSEEVQRKALAESGLLPSGVDVSERFYMRVGEDGAWRRIIARFPDKRILNIGFGIPRECVLPRYYGVDSYRYRYVLDFAFARDLKRFDPCVRIALDPERLKQAVYDAIDSSDIVSFDVFDTLVTRKVLVPSDVFLLVERSAVSRGLPVSGFASARGSVQAQEIHAIYRELQRRFSLSDEDRDRLIQLELDTERSVLIPRPSVIDAFRYALDSGKRVFLVSDMYLPASILSGMLAGFGIRGYEEFFVSCDLCCTKRDGLLGKLLGRGVELERIVHIGDSIDFDIEPAADLDMRAVLVPSALDLALAFGFCEQPDVSTPLVERLASIDFRCALGASIADGFNDPFASKDVRVSILPNDSAAALKRSGNPFEGRNCVHVGDRLNDMPLELRRALLAWYPFEVGERALLLSADEEAFMPLLEERFERVDTQLAAGASYDCIVVSDLLGSEENLRSVFMVFARSIKPEGLLLLGFRNRYGIRYLCGGVDSVVREPFANLAADCQLQGPASMRDLVERASKRASEHACDGSMGFVCTRTYGVMPDASFTQAVYTEDSHLPSGIRDRIAPFDAFASPLVADERDLYDGIVREGMIVQHSNHCLLEFRASSAASDQYSGSC